ncbi:hypothetical protein PVK06_033443 [Gossypium arboreum]|uniref:Reverse transcriptase zinc-binding domain-containing protein n=1 Tax=Gossypium arboreum TaxID=29729 RepID=A0ABR0NBZ5_GOSAR|nr:hypothetical protein PVK06_033443 [Gossypium arboreum]
MEEIHICQHCGKDRMAWPHCLSGQYTVKEGYHLLKKKEEGNRIKKPSSSHCVDEKLWKIIWCLKTLPKVKMFLWRACRNLLVTNQNLCKKKIKDDPMCIVCGNEIESVEHILSTCEGVRNVWFGLNFCFRINKVLITTMDEWLVGIEGLRSPSRWSAPAEGWMVASCDGTFNYGAEGSRNWGCYQEFCWSGSGIKSLKASSAIEVEALAVQEGLFVAGRKVEIDSEILQKEITLTKGTNKVRQEHSEDMSISSAFSIIFERRPELRSNVITVIQYRFTHFLFYNFESGNIQNLIVNLQVARACT